MATNPVHERLFDVLLECKLRGTVPTVTPAAMSESSKIGSARRAAWALIEAGLLKKPAVNPLEFNTPIEIADLVWRLVEAAPPDFAGAAARISAADIDLPMGLPWDDLSRENKKYVVEHPGDFTMLWRQHGVSAQMRFRPLDHEAWDGARRRSRHDVYLWSEEWATLKRLHRRERTLKVARGQMLADFLAERGHITEDKKVFFDQKVQLPFLSTSRTFGADPAKFRTDFNVAVSTLGAQIGALEERLRAFRKVRDQIDSHIDGAEAGWATFQLDYEETVAKAVDTWLEKNPE